jgi:flavin-dependent dehydrogenase
MPSKARPAETCEVLVIGGGPSGAAVAIALRRVGRSVTVLERSRYEAPRGGEALPPEVRRPLMELGVWGEFLAGGPLESPGIASIWGRPEVHDEDFVFNPNGPGWHIDRRRFDLMLARAAERSGAVILRSARPLACIPATPSTWRVDALVQGELRSWHAGVLVDASGRSASPARRLGGPRIVRDRLIAIVGSAPSGSADRRTLVEAVEDGWWYTAALPDDRRVVAFLTDADLIPKEAGTRAVFWRRRLDRTSMVRSGLGPIVAYEPLRVVLARSERMGGAAGRSRIAVGDAAAAYDPLSSQGVTWALESAVAAAEAVDSRLDGDLDAFSDYGRRVEAAFAAFLHIQAGYYSRERRWPESRFWRRRHEWAAS